MSHPTFDLRILLLEEKHRLLACGATYRINPDGLVTAHPISGIVPRAPTRKLLLLMIGFLVFKAGLLAASGEVAYETRRAELAQGQPVEQAAAWLMQPDAATQAIASILTDLL